MGGVEKKWTINYLHKSTERLLYARAIHEGNDKGSWSWRHRLYVFRQSFYGNYGKL